MKKQLLAGMLFMCLAVMQAQTLIPNGGFEQWNANKPLSWDASNFQFMSTPIQTVFRDTVSPAEGSCNVLLQTQFFNLGIVQPTIPGTITLGTITIDIVNATGKVSGGIPFVGRPESFKGFIKAQPAVGDSAMIAIGISKWKGTYRDTIGKGLAWFSVPHSQWVAFDIPVDWSTAETPDSLNIIISSSAVGMEVYVVGSELRIDDVMFEYGNVAIEENFSGQDFRVWADRSGNLYFTCTALTGATNELILYNMQGVEVRSTRLSPHQTDGILSMEGLSPGTYVVSLLGEGERHHSRKIIIH